MIISCIMTSNANDKVSQQNLSKVIGPFFLTPGALNHPVISVDSHNKSTEKDIDIPTMMDVVIFTNDTKNQCRKKPEKKSEVYQCQICHRVYLWKYNLTRHLKYECGTQKRFEYWICNKKFRRIVWSTWKEYTKLLIKIIVIQQCQ